MTLLPNFSRAGRVLAVALVVGAGSLSAAAPVQAQGFGVQVGPNGGGIYVNPGRGPGGDGPGRGPDWDRDRGPRCDTMSDREVERYFRSRDYRDISVRGGGREVTVIARQDGRYYRIEFDTCRSRIIHRERIRR